MQRKLEAIRSLLSAVGVHLSLCRVIGTLPQRVGEVENLIVTPDKSLSYAIIGVGGFLGLGTYDVAIPVDQFQSSDGKIVLPGVTKDTLKAMPPFQYSK